MYQCSDCLEQGLVKLIWLNHVVSGMFRSRERLFCLEARLRYARFFVITVVNASVWFCDDSSPHPCRNALISVIADAGDQNQPARGMRDKAEGGRLDKLDLLFPCIPGIILNDPFSTIPRSSTGVSCARQGLSISILRTLVERLRA